MGLQQGAQAQINAQFINQYDEKATVAASSSDLTVTAFNKTKGAALVQGSDKLKVVATNAVAAIDDEIVVTVLYKGLTTTKTIKVVAPAALAELTFGEVVLPVGQDKITPALTKNVELKYTAKNSLGEEYKLTSADIANGLLISSDNTILDTAALSVTSGKIRIAEFKKAGTVKLTVILPASGTTVTKTIVVSADAGKAESVELEKAEASFAAQSATPIKVGLTVKDNYGTVIAADKVVNSEYAITSDNTDVATAAFGTGDDLGKLVITPKNTTTKGQSAVITVLVKSTGQKSTIKVTADEAAVPTIIEQKSKTTVPTSLLVGGKTDITFEIKDQYGSVLAALGSGYTVEYVSNDDTVVDKVIGGNTDSTTINDLKLRVEAKKAGNATMKAQLKKGTVVVSEKAYPIQVLANTTVGSTYTVTPVEPIYKELLSQDLAGQTLGTATVASNLAKMVASGYAEKLELKVTQGSSTSVVPTSALANAPEVIVKKADGSGETTGKITVFEHEGSYYAYTSTAFIGTDFALANNATGDAKGEVTFTVNAEDGLKVVTAPVTVSKDALKAVSVEFKSVSPGTVDATDVSAKTVETVAKLGSEGIAATYLWVEDQFGGYSLADTQTEAQALLKLVKGTNSEVATPTITVGTNTANTAQTGVIKATATTLIAKENNATVRLYSQIGSLTDTVNITISKENVLPVATLPAATGLTNNATTLVATFNEELYNNTTAIVDGADVKALFAYDGTGANYTSATYNAANKTVTFVFTAAEDAKKLTAQSALKDANGNSSTDVYTYTAAGTIWAK